MHGVRSPRQRNESEVITLEVFIFIYLLLIIFIFLLGNELITNVKVKRISMKDKKNYP